MELKKGKKKLKLNKSKSTIKDLDSEYDRLTNKSKMGNIFKVLVVSCL